VSNLAFNYQTIVKLFLCCFEKVLDYLPVSDKLLLVSITLFLAASLRTSDEKWWGASRSPCAWLGVWPGTEL